MTIAIDEVLTFEGDQGFVDSVTLPKTIDSAPTALVVLFNLQTGGTFAGGPTSVTYNGLPLTVTQHGSDATTDLFSATLLDPPSGIHDLVFNFIDASYQSLYGNAYFLSGDIASFSDTAFSDVVSENPTMAITKAATSAALAMVFSVHFDAVTFQGSGTSRLSAGYLLGASQMPAEGTGDFWWTESTFEGDFNIQRNYGLIVEVIETSAPVVINSTNPFQLLMGS